MNRLLSSNSVYARLGRTIIQGVMAVIIANIDYLIGGFVLDPAQKTLIVALVMAVLSPCMALMSKANEDNPLVEEDDN